MKSYISNVVIHFDSFNERIIAEKILYSLGYRHIEAQEDYIQIYYSFNPLDWQELLNKLNERIAIKLCGNNQNIPT